MPVRTITLVEESGLLDVQTAETVSLTYSHNPLFSGFNSNIIPVLGKSLNKK